MRLAARPLPLEHLSPTSMSLFAACPEQFRQRYILGRPDQNFGDRFMGIVNHDTVAQLLHLKMNGHPFDTDAIRSIYRKNWEDDLGGTGEPDWRDDDPVEKYSIGLLMAITYAEQAIPNISPVAIEQEVEMKIPGVPKIRGYVDVIEQGKIRERKTTNKKVTKPTSKWRFQARVYQYICGLDVEWDVLTRQVEPKLYTAEEYPDLRLGHVSRENTERLIRDVYLQMQDLWLRRGEYEAWPQTGFWDPWLCSYCPIGPHYGGTCSAWS